MSSGQGPSSIEREPDYRFSLANERTFLAYVRTALALDAAGLAIVQFLSDVASPGVRRVAGAVLALAALVTTVHGYWRWRSNQRAMRLGEPLPTTSLPLLLAASMVAASVVALVLVAFGSDG